jgi:hypothetical protein
MFCNLCGILHSPGDRFDKLSSWSIAILGIRGNRKAARKHGIREVRHSANYRIRTLAKLSSNNPSIESDAVDRRTQLFRNVKTIRYAGGAEEL